MIWTGPAPRESHIVTSERIEADAKAAAGAYREDLSETEPF